MDDTGLGEACAVGLFEPNPLGLCDLAGNLWEWQDNLYAPRVTKGKRHPRLSDGVVLATNDEAERSDRPALRGGSWFNSTDGARCASRDWTLPVDFINCVGVRVVLSLVEKDS